MCTNSKIQNPKEEQRDEKLVKRKKNTGREPFTEADEAFQSGKDTA